MASKGQIYLSIIHLLLKSLPDKFHNTINERQCAKKKKTREDKVWYAKIHSLQPLKTIRYRWTSYLDQSRGAITCASFSRGGGGRHM